MEIKPKVAIAHVVDILANILTPACASAAPIPKDGIQKAAIAELLRPAAEYESMI